MLEESKKEHSAIVNTLNNVKKLGIRSIEGQDELLSAKNSILNHMKKEDKEFYPVLRKVAKHNQRLKETLNEFDKDMARI
jgi:hemerythrin-like domain-containing protein